MNKKNKIKKVKQKGIEFFRFGIAIEDIKIGDVCYFDKRGRIRRARTKDVK